MRIKIETQYYINIIWEIWEKKWKQKEINNKYVKKIKNSLKWMKNMQSSLK